MSREDVIGELELEVPIYLCYRHVISHNHPRQSSSHNDLICINYL